MFLFKIINNNIPSFILCLNQLNSQVDIHILPGKYSEVNGIFTDYTGVL